MARISRQNEIFYSPQIFTKYLPLRSAGDIVRFKKGPRGHPSTAEQITIQDTTEKSADICKKIRPRRRGVKKKKKVKKE